LHSREWGGYHPAVRELERAFAELHGVPHAVSCANGTVALEVALRALGIGRGDEVIVPPITFIASASAVLLCQGAPVFADIDPVTLNLSPRAAEAAITGRTRAIVVVHFGGQPAEMDALQELARRHNLAIVEDSAHAHGACWQGKPVGGWGDAGTFSFQSFKLMTAGEGGMIVTRSADVAELCWSYCNQGRRRDGGWFEHVRLGTNYRMTGFQAAVLNAQLRKLSRQTEVRNGNLAHLRERLREFPCLTLADDDPRASRHPRYLITLRYHQEHLSGLPRDRAIAALQAEGIPAKPTYPYPLYRNPLFRKESDLLARHQDWHAPQDYQNLSLREAERVCRDGIWLNHQVLLGNEKDVDDILMAVEKLQRHASSLLAAKGAASQESK
ncbi:MAG: DegT/DnrJ/EryC1/StrS family aminotransferase, partial [Acidobacteria bacterium]|nr:DegT/DnrJ/EryC1/StrS family aminotransferase [Acidobacteriota bacterium]